ncbi:MAG: TonB family protein [bacterium]
MKRDIVLSLCLHAAIIMATVVSAPFDLKRQKDFGEVIRVSLTSLPEITPSEPTPITVPKPMLEVLPDIPIDAPTTAAKAVIESEPKKKEEPKKPKPKTTGQVPSDAGAGEKEIESSATGGGSPFQGATIDNASFDYPYWFTQAFNKIAGNWRNPVGSDATLVCVVYFQVIRSGRLIELRVETSSGFGAFDDACLQAVQSSSPFPPLPREFRDEIIGITLPFKYASGY